MKKTKEKAGRREFLRSAIQTLLVVPVAGVTPIPKADAAMLLNEPDEPLPGERGYREQGVYSNWEEE